MMATFKMIDGERVFSYKTRIPGVDNLDDLPEKPAKAEAKAKSKRKKDEVKL